MGDQPAVLGVRFAGFAAVIVAVTVASACGDDAAAPADAGGDAAGDGGAAGDVVESPRIGWWTPETGGVEPPFQQMTCPPGFRRVVEHGISLCEPWPETGRMDCGRGTAHFPGTAGCEPVGAACPAGEFSEDLPADRPVLHVDAAAPGGGDGSLAAPYSTVGAALTAAPTEAVVALAKGAFDAVAPVADGVVLWGACAEETVIGPTFLMGTAPAVTIDGAGELRHLTVVSNGGGISLRSGSARLEGVVVEDVHGVGIASDGSDLSMTRVVVSGTVRGTRASATGVALRAGTGIARQLLVVGSQDRGIEVSDTSVLLDNVVVADTTGGASGSSGIGMSVLEGSNVMGDHLTLEGSEGRGAQVGAPDAVVTLTELIVRDTATGFGGREGMGLLAVDGATVEIARGRFERNHTAAVQVSSGDPAVGLSQVLIRDTLPEEGSGAYGMGLMVFSGSTSFAGGVIERSHDGAILAHGTGTELSVRNVLIRDVEPVASGEFGRGIGVQLGTAATVESTVIERTRELGVFVAGSGATATLSDVVVRDTLGAELEGISGRALSVEVSGAATLERVLLERSHELGLISMDADSSVSGSHVTVREVEPRMCAETTCPDEPFGIGVGAYYGASLELTSFRITDMALCGLQVAAGGNIDIARGEVSGSEIGACVQIDGYDLDRLTDEVSYRDNGSNLESTTLPVPEPN